MPSCSPGPGGARRPAGTAVGPAGPPEPEPGRGSTSSLPALPAEANSGREPCSQGLRPQRGKNSHPDRTSHAAPRVTGGRTQGASVLACLLPEPDGDVRGLSSGGDEGCGVFRVKETEAPESWEAHAARTAGPGEGLPGGGLCGPHGTGEGAASGRSVTTQGERVSHKDSLSLPTGGVLGAEGHSQGLGRPRDGRRTRLSPGRSNSTRLPLECAQPNSNISRFNALEPHAKPDVCVEGSLSPFCGRGDRGQEPGQASRRWAASSTSCCLPGRGPRRRPHGAARDAGTWRRSSLLPSTRLAPSAPLVT